MLSVVSRPNIVTERTEIGEVIKIPMSNSSTGSIAIKAFAACPTELQPALKDELDQLGAYAITEQYRGLNFKMLPEDFYATHLKCRLASRLALVLREASAKTPEMLFSQACRIAWEGVFTDRSTFMIEGVAGDRGDNAMPASLISKKVREALQNRLARAKRPPAKVDLQEPDIKVIAFVRDGKVSISVDTTGKAMHKRGYRVENHPAPLKETLAAALLKLAEYDPKRPFVDLMCGSGTIAIEAAYLAMNKAPLIHRKKGEFGLERLANFDKDLWRKVQEDCRKEKAEQPAAAIKASDLHAPYIEQAKANALRGRVEKFIDFQIADFFAQTPETMGLADSAEQGGLLLVNAPYGERLMEAEELKTLYKRIGDHLKLNFAGWRAGLLVAFDTPHKHIGLRPTRKIPIKNGSIECRLLIFDLYKGRRAVLQGGR